MDIACRARGCGGEEQAPYRESRGGRPGAVAGGADDAALVDVAGANEAAAGRVSDAGRALSARAWSAVRVPRVNVGCGTQA